MSSGGTDYLDWTFLAVVTGSPRSHGRIRSSTTTSTTPVLHAVEASARLARSAAGVVGTSVPAGARPSQAPSSPHDGLPCCRQGRSVGPETEANCAAHPSFNLQLVAPLSQRAFGSYEPRSLREKRVRQGRESHSSLRSLQCHAPSYQRDEQASPYGHSPVLSFGFGPRLALRLSIRLSRCHPLRYPSGPEESCRSAKRHFGKLPTHTNRQRLSLRRNCVLAPSDKDCRRRTRPCTAEGGHT